MATAADSATHSLSMLICSYTSRTLGTEHKIALLIDPRLGNSVNFPALPPRG